MTLDRKDWPPGPWDNEPNEASWVDAASAMQCQARRNPLGAWCGYVSVIASHPFHGTRIDEVEGALEVHGGVTFCGNWDADDPLWWVGFDCSHGWDTSPGMLALLIKDEIPLKPLTPPLLPEAEYRDLRYVKKECKKLASQLRLVEKLFAERKEEAIEWLIRVNQEMQDER